MSAIIKKPILPKITIKKNDASLYTFDPTAGANPPTSGTYDFRLTKASIKAPYDSTGGRFEITITSTDATNAAMNTILTNIREDNEVTIWVGKTAATLIKIFLGKIETMEVKEPNKNIMYVTISGPDWGSDILKNLVCNGSWIQQKTIADQNVLDIADKHTTIGQITDDLLKNSKSFPDLLYPIAPDDLGVIVTTGNYPDISTSYQVSQFEANMERVDDKLIELDELGGTVHYIDAEKTFYMKPAEIISDSGVLFTDDTADSLINPTYNTKVGFIAPGSTYTKNIESHKARLYGVGSSTFSVDQSKETIADSTSLVSSWYAQQFTPVKQDCYSIGVYVGYTGTPSIDLTLLLVEDNGNLPTGSTLRTLAVSYTALSPGTGKWYYFPIEQKLTVGNVYWVVLAGNFAGNTYKWFHDGVDAVTPTSAKSTDGVTWALTGAGSETDGFIYSFVEYANDPLVQIFPSGITSATKHLHDEVIRRPDITNNQYMYDYIQGLYSRLGDRKEIFRGRIYAPDTLLKPNQLVRIRKGLSGYAIDSAGTSPTYFVLGQVEYVFDSSEDEGTGQLYLDVEAVRFTDYP